jgi:acetyl-CoA C-acetyltransferase
MCRPLRIQREVQDRIANLAVQGGEAQKAGLFDAKIVPVTIARRNGEALVVAKDERPRETSMEALAMLKGVFTARSPPAVPQASTTAPARCCWRARPSR